MQYSKDQSQNIEQRSIAVFQPNEGPQSLPFTMDRKVFAKTKEERTALKNMQNQFKGNGLFEWNERNRPGNNKKAA
jgi:hypothetical protein